jgi:signal transduction histidine kinase/DNA-binding NarL/FixJ family response regulator
MPAVPVQLSFENTNRAEDLFRQDLQTIERRVDRMFVALLVFEWVAGIIVALTVSPTMWEGLNGSVHQHVYAAVYLGGLIIAFPILVASLLPGTKWSRHAIAAGQVLFSSLLIHLTGGRIETHFHIFGSLAFLAMYRDWKVLITASAIVAVDHILRGIFWPYSVYASSVVSPWRWVEHLAWVCFEDGVLIIAIRQSLLEMHAIATRQTALEDAMRRAESADKAKGAFLAQMSHEIRTPMTAILGYADMMAIEGDAVEAVQAIRRNGRHLLTVLDDILDLSKIEADQLRIEKAVVDVPELLREVQHLMAPRALQRGTTLSLELRNLPAALLTDAVRLRQIVLNFTSNAIKFTANGTVRIVADFVMAQNNTGVLTIRVVDTGIGLTLEQQGRLFKAFSQADDMHHRLYGGTGLGLVISQRLARLLGGEIYVESEVGVGSTFCVRLPLMSADPPAPTIPPVNNGNSLLPTPGAGKRILVVDDASDNRRLLRRLLAHGKLQVDVAEDGSGGVTAALAAWNDDHPYDLILMDMLMPKVDGYEATRQLRERGYAGLIFALTAHASKHDEQRCRNAGCDDYIMKPFDCAALLSRVHGAVQAAEQPPKGSSSNRPEAHHPNTTAPVRRK